LSDLEAVENQLGCAIPTSFRRVLLEFSRRTRIEWALPKGVRPPGPFRQIWAGECRWDLTALPELQRSYHAWLEVFTNPDDFWEEPWQNKFPVLEVGNGDMVVIDLATPHRVIYLSHEGDDTLHGFWLGSDFEDYVDRITRIGCVGSEDWQLAPFVAGPRSLIDPDGAAAREWREWFGLRLSTNPA
jgi:hypothetical protein